MTILDRTKATSTGSRYVIRTPFSVELDSQKIGYDQETLFGEQHQLRMTLTVRFSCNKAQYKQAHRNAQRLLLHDLYKDTLHQIELCQHALYSCNTEEAVRILDEMRQELVG